MKETVILILLVQISSFIMFILGIISSKFFGGYKKHNTLNPIEIIKENKKEKEEKKEGDLKQKQTKVLLSNIENYNGTSLGQKEIPRD